MSVSSRLTLYGRRGLSIETDDDFAQDLIAVDKFETKRVRVLGRQRLENERCQPLAALPTRRSTRWAISGAKVVLKE